MAGPEATATTPQATTEVAAPAAPDYSAIYSGELDWSDERAIGAAMAKAGLIEPEAVPDRDLNATLRELGHEPGAVAEEVAEATQPDTEAAVGDDTTPNSDEGTATPAAAAPAAAEVSAEPAAVAATAETTRLQKELDAANAKLAAIEKVKEKTQTQAERATVLQELVDELGEDHPSVKAQKSLNKQFDALEARLTEADEIAKGQKAELESAQEVAFHAAQMRVNKLLGAITEGKPLDPTSSPEAAMVKFFSDRRVAEAAEKKITRTREQTYALVESDLKAHFPALAEKHYPKAPPVTKEVPKVQPKAVVKKAATGIQTLSDIPGGAVEQPTRSKGVFEVDPTKLSKGDFAQLMKDLTS